MNSIYISPQGIVLLAVKDKTEFKLFEIYFNIWGYIVDIPSSCLLIKQIKQKNRLCIGFITGSTGRKACTTIAKFETIGYK